MDHTVGRNQRATQLFNCHVYSDQVIMPAAPVHKEDHGSLLTLLTVEKVSLIKLVLQNTSNKF